MALSLNGWKCLSMLIFAIISVLGAAVAVAMKENAEQLYISCGVLFSAGVLLAGGFDHLLADSNEQFSEMEMGASGEFPWAFYVAGVTIVGLVCIDIVMERLIEDYFSSHSRSNKNSEENDTLAENESSMAIRDQCEESEVNAFIEQNHDHNHMHVDPENSFSAIILTVALSIHCIIEGVGIGASSNISAIESAFIAVVVHKGFTAFSLAQALVSSGYWSDRPKRKYFYISIGTFTSTSLLGIVIGWWISSSSGGDNILTATLIGITAGSFIFVAIVEILPQETRAIKRERLFLPPVLFSFIAGYWLMSVLALWV